MAPLLAANAFHYDLMIKICLTAIVAVGLNLLVGYAGQVSLGHAAFYAGGAYASALLTQNYEFTPLPAMLTAAVAVVSASGSTSCRPAWSRASRRAVSAITGP